jgi:hypothetical protein
MVTSNHIHLLVVDDGDRDVIPNSIQLVAGRTGQEYNQRKDRRGAYWENRYHASAVESGNPGTVNGLHGYKHGASRCGQASIRCGLSAVTMRFRSGEERTC